MTKPTGIVEWRSTADPSRRGVELFGFAAEHHRLEAELDKGLGRSDVLSPAFVLTSVASSRPQDISLAISRASSFASRARMCVALDEAALQATNSAELRKANVGIVLDGVDADTRLSVLSKEFIEAVRFDQAFLRQARQDARSACVLAAMLGLAHDLGLATLGTMDALEEASEFTFDYVSPMAPA